MYWEAVMVRYSDKSKRVGIFIYSGLLDKIPELVILGGLREEGVKKKWRVPMKVKRWLLYDYRSYPSASSFIRRNIFGDIPEVKTLGKREQLYCFDEDIIVKNFPVTAERIKKKK